jgi:hypothetical protein
MTAIFGRVLKFRRFWRDCDDMRGNAMKLSYYSKMDLRILHMMKPSRSSEGHLRGSSRDLNVVDLKFAE